MKWYMNDLLKHNGYAMNIVEQNGCSLVKGKYTIIYVYNYL